MSETIDPIIWLRDQATATSAVNLNTKTNELEMENSGLKIPKDAQTAWKRKDGKGYYTVGSLWICLKMREAKAAEYSREANKLGLPLVDFRDKRDVIDYFSGAVSESAQIDTAMRA